ncbi:MAG: MBL fold metallo-hydrolase [Chloroflexi bacterium]|nr:MBL fold metallo-hydrolase [Chloroflexota bacterium]
MKDKPRQVAPGVYMLEAPFSLGLGSRNEESLTLCYLVHQAGGWLMVDSGYNDRGCYDALCQQLDALGISLRDIRWLVITHYHPDHSGLSALIRAASGARVVLHRDDWNILQSIVGSSEEWNIHGLIPWVKSLGVPPTEIDGFRQMATFGRRLFPMGLDVDVLLQGEENPVGDSGHLRAILTPGHSPGHICIYDQKDKLLFSGDHVLVEITPHISPSHLTSRDQLRQYLAALRKVQHLDVDLVLPAHERPFGHLSRRVDEILDHHSKRLEEVLQSLFGQMLSPWDIAHRVEWDVGRWDQMDATNRVLAVRETVAHLQLLEQRGQVAPVERDGVNLYKLAGDG